MHMPGQLLSSPTKPIDRDLFFELSNDLLCELDYNGFFKRINPAWQRVLGYTRAEILSKSFIDFIHPDDRASTLSIFKSECKGDKIESDFKTRYFTKSGQIIWLSWRGVISEGTFYGVVRDVTNETLDKIKAENQLAWLNEVVQRLPVPFILATAGDGQVLSASAEIKNLLDGSKMDEESKPAGEGCFFADSSGQAFERKNWPRFRAARGEKLNGELMSWHTPRCVTFLQVWSRIIPAIYDHSEMVVVVLQNVNQLKERETLLRVAIDNLGEQKRLRENFVSTLSHDLRTPLTSAKIGVQLLARVGSANPSVIPKHSELVIKCIDRITKMIGDLLDANRIEAGETVELVRTKFDLALLVQSVIKSLTLTYGDRFNTQIEENLVGNWSEAHLRRLIENLINNAVKYGDLNQPIAVKLSRESLQRVKLSVHNFGEPISREDQGALFEQYTRTESALESGKPGWGLGLALVKEIAIAHGGEVSVQSGAGEGTSFTVILPY